MPTQHREIEAIVRNMLNESGGTDGFDVKTWVAEWMNTTMPALGDKTPLQVAQTPAGFEQVKQALSAIQSGAYL